MKKLLALLSICFMSCASNDDTHITDFEVTEHSNGYYHHNQSLGYKLAFSACVKNNTPNQVIGYITFTVPNDNGAVYVYINNVTIQSGENKCSFVQDNTWFDEGEVYVSNVTFTKN